MPDPTADTHRPDSEARKPTWFKDLFQTTDPSRRRIKEAVIVGLIAGTFSAIVKFGWEVPFPPRTPGFRSDTNPPQTMLEWCGMSSEQVHTTVTFSNNPLPIYSFIVHFNFVIVFGVLYCVLAEYFPKVKLWQGALFGIGVWIGAHIIVMPLFGWAPNPWPWASGTHQPLSEHFSELFGHIVWMWSIEIVRRDLRNRFTHEPDAEVPLVAATR